MSSSRRRGRSPGAPAHPQSPTVTAAPDEVADALLAETPAGEDQDQSGQEPDVGGSSDREESDSQPMTVSAESPALEAAAEQPAAETAVAEDAVVEEPAAEEPLAEADAASAESAPGEAQGAADDRPAAPAIDEPVEAVAAATESVASDTADIIEAQAETLAAAALLPTPAGAVPSEGAESAPSSKPHSVRIGASFAFVPPLVPLSEINARLFAFARGEGEAAVAHFQALVRAKSPAEAIRLQVTEMQRAADASLTCFSEIVRSANRLSDNARRH